MAERTYLNFTRERFERFKKAYEAAEGEVFTFENKPFLKDYARHLVNYLSLYFPETDEEADKQSVDSAEEES